MQCKHTPIEQLQLSSAPLLRSLAYSPVLQQNEAKCWSYNTTQSLSGCMIAGIIGLLIVFKNTTRDESPISSVRLHRVEENHGAQINLRHAVILPHVSYDNNVNPTSWCFDVTLLRVNEIETWHSAGNMCTPETCIACLVRESPCRPLALFTMHSCSRQTHGKDFERTSRFSHPNLFH